MTSDDSMDQRPRGAHFSGSTDASVPAPPRAVPGPDETTAFIIAAGASSHGSVPGTADARDSDFAQRPASPDETAAFMVAAQYASAPASGSASVRADETAQFALLDGDLDEDAPLGWDDDLPVRHACGEAAEVDDTFMFASLAEADGPSGAVEAPAQDPVSGDSAEEDEASAEDVGRSAALMSGLVIVSRITGFFRTWAQAFGMGTTLVSSAFTVANNMPNALYELVMGGMLVTAFLPVYVSTKKKAGREGASAYASNLLSLVTLLMGALSVLSFIFAGEIIWTQSFNASAQFDFDLATYFFRFFAIEIVLYALSSVISSVLNAERDYFWSTAAPIANNIVITVAFLLYGLLVDSNPQAAILVLAVSNPLGVLVQVLMQVPALRRHGVKLRVRIDVHDPLIRETLSIGIPTLVVTVVSFATTSVQSSCALSVNPSGAAITYYARIWYILPYSVFAIPITTAMFTELSSFVASGRMKRFIDGLAQGSGQILFLLIPFALYLIVFSPCLANMLRGSKMPAEDVHALAVYIGWLSLSLPGYGLCTYLQKACSSLRKMKLFAVAECIAGAIQIAICLVFTPRFGFNVVGFSSTFFFVSIDLVTLAFLRHELGRIGARAMLRASVRATVLGIAGAGVGFAILAALQALVMPLSEGGMLVALLYAVAGGIPAVLVTFGVAIARNMPEVAFLSSMLSRFLPKRAGAR
ncbi:murein biosynthesis integral membrane protein MurJ [Collinsella phocaeensis]|uniref:murein biosynthesis integral membrane protein MurJ n=1 Tax=Collinsella phocaeensis TaxID=1871016 RepID=UPI000ACA19B3|nr:murein biosynthesis integral membrane protein MurJ [Collinsella phocaeensis]